MVTFKRLIAFLHNSMRLWSRRSLARDYLEAKYVLGERMYAVGIDDGRLAEQIAHLDSSIREAEKVGASARALRAERKDLILQLAAAALAEDAPLPGADDEYQKARQAESALHAPIESIKVAKSSVAELATS